MILRLFDLLICVHLCVRQRTDTGHLYAYFRGL